MSDHPYSGPYDEDTLDRVHAQLYEQLPTLYRVDDQPPRGSGDLLRFLRVLAAPLAVVRQSIEELHADLFIDTADDSMLALLAEMVGTTLLLPDPDANRRDVRGTVGWRRRKGTVSALQELSEELSDQLVVTHEGWKRVMVSQDLRILIGQDLHPARSERQIPDIRSPLLPEIASGPLDELHHAVDLRSISRRTGRYHPKHIVHWVHPTRTFPLRGAVPRLWGDPASGHPDHRFVFLPRDWFNDFHGLRARRVDAADRLPTDRIPAHHFAAAPGEWFGHEGRFAIRLCGLLAGVAPGQTAARRPSKRVPSPTLTRGTVNIEPLAGHESLRAILRIDLYEVPRPATLGVPDSTLAVRRAAYDLSRVGASVVSSAPLAGPLAGSDKLLLLRLRPDAGSLRTPELDLVISSDRPAAARASTAPELAQEGFLRGALHVRVPALSLTGERWFYVGADGSLYAAQQHGSGAIDVEVSSDPDFPLEQLDPIMVGPGSAWPLATPTGDPEPFAALPLARGRGPVILHGGRVLVGTSLASAAARCALSFGIRYVSNAATVIEPMAILDWTGPDPLAAPATWRALPLTSDVDTRYHALSELLRGGQALGNVQLVIRFESDLPGSILAPAEIAITGRDGETILAHLPELSTSTISTTMDAAWPASDGAYDQRSSIHAIGRDGSSWLAELATLERLATGAVAPLAQHLDLRRRLVAGRTLCAWRNEAAPPTPPDIVPATAAGRLDVDVAHGLFSLSADDPLPANSLGPTAVRPPAISVDLQDAFTANLGARATVREPLLGRRLATPTRLVAKHGHVRDGGGRELDGIPIYESLGAALSAITSDGAQAHEVVEFQDSATYAAESLTWPSNATLTHLTIQAAELTRPTVLIDSLTSAGPIDTLELIGIAFGSATLSDLVLPEPLHTSIAFCTILDDDNSLRFVPRAGTLPSVELFRSVTGPLLLVGGGRLDVDSSIVQSLVGGFAITSPIGTEGMVTLRHATIDGRVECLELEASDSICHALVEVHNRFRGCIRYSRVSEGSILPSRHKVSFDKAEVLSRDRSDPAFQRLSGRALRSITTGAENGSEMGAFNSTHLARIYEGLRRRLEEHTPAGLVTGLVRMD